MINLALHIAEKDRSEARRTVQQMCEPFTEIIRDVSFEDQREGLLMVEIDVSDERAQKKLLQALQARIPSAGLNLHAADIVKPYRFATEDRFVAKAGFHELDDDLIPVDDF